jgi:hypothetical protein
MFTRAVAVAAVTALAAIPAVSASASGGGSSGIEVGGTSIGYFVGASSTTSSAGSTGSSATEVPGLAQAGSSGDAQLAAGAPGGAAPAGCGFPYVCLGSGIYAGIAPPYIPPASAAPPTNANQPAVPPATLAAQAWHDLDLPAPVIETAPPRGTDGLVGLREYFWLAPGQWTPKTTQAQAGKTSVQVSAIPQQLVIQPGPGLPALACDGPGTPYSTATSSQADPCSYTYQESSLFQPAHGYQVTAAVTWGGTWTGSGGTGGTLPPVTRTAVFALPVEEGRWRGHQGRPGTTRPLIPRDHVGHVYDGAARSRPRCSGSDRQAHGRLTTRRPMSPQRARSPANRART